MLRRNTAPSAPTPPRSEADAIASLIAERCSRVDKLLRQIRRTREEVREDDIHDLRVATRRADAALRLFRDWLPRRRGRTLRRILGRLRQAAGRVRDLDVVGQSLQHLSSELPDAAGQQLSQLLEKRRRQACRSVVRLARRKSRRKLRKSAQRVVHRVRWRGSGSAPSSADLLTVRLATLAQLADNPRWLHTRLDSEIHALRIKFRKLRYELELLAVGATSSAHDLNELLELLRQIQDRLGAMHDAAIQGRLLSHWFRKQPLEAKDRPTIEDFLANMNQPPTLAARRDAERELAELRALVDRFQGRADEPGKTPTEK